MLRLLQASALVLAAVAAAGCAQRESAIEAAPSQAELPKLEQPEHVTPLSVGVEGRSRTEPRIVFVPEFKEPELTAEEKKALGIRDPEIDFLALYRATVPGRVGPWAGGIDVGVGGQRYRAAAAGTREAPYAIDSRSVAGPVSIVYPFFCPVAWVGPRAAPIWAVGDTGGIRVRENEPSGVAARQPRPEP
jgi:hypothetical protein